MRAKYPPLNKKFIVPLVNTSSGALVRSVRLVEYCPVPALYKTSKPWIRAFIKGIVAVTALIKMLPPLRPKLIISNAWNCASASLPVSFNTAW